MVSSCVNRHNHGMPRLAVALLLLAVGGFGLVLADSVRAQEARTTQVPTTGVLRARGKTAKMIEADRRPERQAFEAPLPIEMEAGVISRAALQSVLASGIGKFLQQVRAEPSVTRGRFIGWRMVSLFPDRSDVHVQVLRAGDTVTRVNGQSIERPEQFMNVWQSLATESDLVLHVERAGKQSQLRYHIVDDKLSAEAPKSSSTRKPTSPSTSTSSP